MAKKVELGDRVRDVITDLEGIAAGITNWLYGCRRVSVQPEQAKDGKPAGMFTVDEPQLVVLEKNAIREKSKPGKRKTTGGPRPDAEPRPNAAR